jgi:hypothetical protein
MKKLFVFLTIAILIAGTVSAQAIREQRREPNSQRKSEQPRNAAPQARNSHVREINSATVEGTLKLDKGYVAVESAGTVYYVPMLNRYIGFITGLREGAKVSVEGREFNNMLQPVKVTIDGKSYDFMAWDRGTGPGYGRQNFQNRDNYQRGSPNSRWNNHGYRNRNSRGGCCW